MRDEIPSQGTEPPKADDPTNAVASDVRPAPQILAARLWRGVRHLRANPGLVLSVAVIVTVSLWTLFPEVFSDHDPLRGVTQDNLRPPSGQYWFGTDSLGRDLYSRVVHGSALSLLTAALAVGIAFSVGSFLGLLAGFVRGRLDDLIMRTADVMLAIPGILLALTIISALGPGPINVAIAVGVGSMASFARLMRSEVLKVRQERYVEAAFTLGTRWWNVLSSHVLPNSLGPVVALATLEFGSTILAVSALSFLGYGALPPAPEWGSLTAEGRDHIMTAWWLITLPGLVVIAVVLAVNRISRAIDEVGNPLSE